MGADSILQRYILDHERPIILVEAHKGIMQEKLPHRRYYAQYYGGQQSTKTQKNTVINVMSSKG
jgi:hypothetical protein